MHVFIKKTILILPESLSDHVYASKQNITRNKFLNHIQSTHDSALLIALLLIIFQYESIRLGIYITMSHELYLF